MPSIRQLEYLVAIAETSHFRRAAEKVGVSQPTLSAQLANMEKRLGVQLVERSRTRVFLTEIGQEIEHIARRVLRDVQEIRDLSAGQLGGMSRVLRLGLAPTVGPYLLPRVVRRIHKAYPDLKLYVREEVPEILPSRLEEGHHDFAVLPLPVLKQDLVSIPLFREPLYLVAAADNPLVKRSSVERGNLKGQPILTLTSGHQLREQVEALCDEFGAYILSDFEGTSLDTVRQMVGMGMGLAFLPGLYVHASLRRDRSVKILPLRGRGLYRTIGMVWRATSAQHEQFSQLAVHFREAARESFPDVTIQS